MIPLTCGTPPWSFWLHSEVFGLIIPSHGEEGQLLPELRGWETIPIVGARRSPIFSTISDNFLSARSTRPAAEGEMAEAIKFTLL